MVMSVAVYFIGTAQASDSNELLKQQTRTHETISCAANFSVTWKESPTMPSKASLGIQGQGRGARVLPNFVRGRLNVTWLLNLQSSDATTAGLFVDVMNVSTC